MTIANNVATKFAIAAVAVAMIFSAFAAPAQAQTTEDLQQMINDLLAQVAGLQSQLGGGEMAAPAAAGVCPFTWTRDLTMGSEGSDVMKLQQFLNANADTRVAATGAGSAGMETMYYGPATAAAVSKMQVAYRAEVLTPNGLVNPTGYFGASSRAKANALCVAAPMEEEGEGEMEEEGETDNGSMTLQGEGTLTTLEVDDEEDILSEGEEDVVVASLTLEAEDGDIELARVTMSLVADAGNEELEPWDTFDEVSLWIDGDKVASFDASDEDEYLDEDDGTFRFSNLDLVLEEDEEVEVLVAVSVMNSVDGADAAAAQWDIEPTSVRYFDADGVAETSSTIGDLGDAAAVITFNIEEAGADDEASIERDSDSPDSATLKVEDNTSESEEYLVYSFEIEVDDESSDLILEDSYVWVSITNPAGGAASIDSRDVVSEITLTIDGVTEEGDAVVNETTAIADGATVRVGYVFEFDEIELEADETYIAEVNMTFEGADIDSVTPANNAYDAGTTILLDVDAQEVGAKWEVEGVENDFVLTGTDSSETHTLNTVVPVISGVTVSESVNDAGTAGSVSFTFSVEADGDDDIAGFDVADIVSTVSGGLLDPTPVLTRTGGDTPVSCGAGCFDIADGDDVNFALTYTFAAGAGNNGVYFVNVDSILGVEVDETSEGLDINGN